MIIKEIELNNFRIYKGSNKIKLVPDGNKNIVVVSGKNGFGKTTFLMSLVWCLYGRQMEKVDELYKKEIYDKGGYGKYIGNSLNRLAHSNGETTFSTSITFSGVRIPDITCKEIKVTRSFDVKRGTNEKIDILIDGYPNELIQDLSRDNQSGEEIFIRDFILPLEIAKFFFFDAEKIVSLAEVDSPDQRKALSKAYSEVLGIHKYEELKEQLESLQDDYRRKSAKPQERKEFISVEANIKIKQEEIQEADKSIDKLHQERAEKKYESDQIQKTLIREGNHMSIEQVNELKTEESNLEQKITLLQNDLKDLFDLIPFGLAGETLMDLSTQLSHEKNFKVSQFRKEEVENKTNEVLRDLEVEKSKTNIVFDNIKMRNFYEAQIEGLIKKHFYPDFIELPDQFEAFQNFSDLQSNQLNELINNLKLSFKESFTRINHEYSQAKSQIDTIRRKLREAEKNAENSYIAELRKKKEALDSRIIRIDADVESINQNIGSLKNELKAFKQKQEELRKKIDVSDINKAIDDKSEQLITTLKSFIIKFKEEKKKSLEEKIKEGLNTLMHKKNFITRVEVDISISGDDVEISLYSKIKGKEQKLDKGTLSMGERQMYASALLNALVDESDIEFPVFIDSPMQKFDKEHAENIIKHFYPRVSDQVVILPLIHKELTESEYKLLKKNVSTSYLIQNIDNDHSSFLQVKPDNLIEQYNELYVASN